MDMEERESQAMNTGVEKDRTVVVVPMSAASVFLQVKHRYDSYPTARNIKT